MKNTKIVQLKKSLTHVNIVKEGFLPRSLKIPRPTFILLSNARTVISKMFLNIILLFIYSLSGVCSSVIGMFDY